MAKKYFLDDMYDSLPCGLVLFKNSDNLEILSANPTYYDSFAEGNEETLNICDSDKKSLAAAEKKLADNSSVELHYSTASGEKRICMLLRRYNSETFLGALWDMTHQHKLMSNIQNERDKFALAMLTSNNVIFEHNIADDSATFYIPSKNAHEINEKRISNYNDYIRTSGVESDYVDFFLKLFYNESEKTVSAKMKLPDDKNWTWYRMHRQFEHDKNGKLIRIYGIISNIEDEKKHEKELKRKIEMDTSLNVFNRNAAVDRINEYLRNNPDRRDYALLVMDIDDFKSVNDTYGHLYGDAVIEMAANALNKVIGRKGIVGRYGGDEFFALIKECTDEQICQKANEILSAFNTLQSADEHNITCSIGIALGTSYEQPVTYKDMFEKADKALYYVKNSGKAKWEIFDDDKMSEINGYAIGYETLDINNKDLLESKDMMKVFLELSAGAKSSDNVIGRIMRYITERVKFDRMRVLYVDCSEDLIAIKHDWCAELDYRSFSSKSGYYIHSDIMRFRNYFEENPIFEIDTKNAEGFSLKFSREFEKNMKNNAIYIANTTSDNYFYMFECTRFGKDRPWTTDEWQELNVATKILTMYVAQAEKETENEHRLKELLDLDRKTGLYSFGKFFEQMGKLRIIAAEADENVAVVHTDFKNFLDFNLKFGQEEGDNVLVAFSEHIIGNNDPENSICTHMDGTDMFVSAFRINTNAIDFAAAIEEINKQFCDTYNEKYPGANLILKSGIYILKPDDIIGDGLDKAVIAKRKVKEFDSSFCVMYED